MIQLRKFRSKPNLDKGETSYLLWVRPKTLLECAVEPVNPFHKPPHDVNTSKSTADQGPGVGWTFRREEPLPQLNH